MTGSRRRIVLAVAALLALAGVGSGSYGFSGLDRQTRSIRASKGKSLIAQIRSGDKIVVVVASGTRPLMVLPPSGENPVDFYAGLADVVLHIRVVDRASRITEVGDWVKTRVSATILEVLKADARLKLNSGEPWTFAEEGGEVIVDAVTVRGTVPWARPSEIGSEYVVFAKVSDDGSVRVGPSTTYKVSADGLVSLVPGAPAAIGRLGPVADAFARIKGK
jgi:hypothetical protein